MFVVFLDDSDFVFLVFLSDKFLCAEEVDDVVVVGFFHRLVDLSVGECFVAGEVYFTHFGLGFLVDSQQHFDIARMVLVVLLQHIHFGIVETFLSEVFFDDSLGVVLEVRRHLRALTDTHFDFHIFFLAFLESFVAHFAHTRALLQVDDQPYLVAFDLFRTDLNRREQTLFPETFDGLGDLVAGHFDLIAYGESGEADEDKILIAVSALHLDACYLVGLTRHAVFDIRHSGCDLCHRVGLCG